MKIDSHIHFLEYNEVEYPWINNSMELLKNRFLPGNLEELINQIQFDGVVAIQARQLLKETEWLLDLAEKHKIVKGVVGWVDLCSNNVGEQLEKYAKQTKLKGVRHVIHDEPDDDFMLRKDFGKGIGLLKEFGLTYDLLIFERHLPQTIKLVKKHPEQLFVINHIAKPNINKHKVSKSWYEHMKILSTFENVYCKVSGLVTEVEWDNDDLSIFNAYLDKVFELFPSNKLMIGSDWPVCTLAKNYQSVMNIVMNYIKKFPKQDQANVLGKTCSTFYNL